MCPCVSSSEPSSLADTSQEHARIESQSMGHAELQPAVEQGGTNSWRGPRLQLPQLRLPAGRIRLWRMLNALKAKTMSGFMQDNKAPSAGQEDVQTPSVTEQMLLALSSLLNPVA